MHKVVFSSPGESTTYKRFTSAGTALPDSPLSRKTLSMATSPKEPMALRSIAESTNMRANSVTSK